MLGASVPKAAVHKYGQSGLAEYKVRFSEYGLMAALISVAAITAMGALGNSLANTFNFVESQEVAAQNGQL